MPKNKKPMERFSVRIDAGKMKELEKSGLDFGEIVRQAIDKALGSKVCPTCGAKKEIYAK